MVEARPEVFDRGRTISGEVSRRHCSKFLQGPRQKKHVVVAVVHNKKSLSCCSWRIHGQDHTPSQVYVSSGKWAEWGFASFHPAWSPTTPSRRRQCTWNSPRRATRRNGRSWIRPW